MLSAKLTTKEGTTWTTSVNGTKEIINAYFLNKVFNVGVFPIEKMEKVVKVEILNKKDL